MIAPPLLQSQVTGLTIADSPQFAGVNVGHASDTTITRVSAGQIAVEGVNVATTATKLDDFATPDDNADLDASTARHGLLKKLSNVATEFLNGQGNWATPAGGGGSKIQIAIGAGQFNWGDGSSYWCALGNPTSYSEHSTSASAPAAGNITRLTAIFTCSAGSNEAFECELMKNGSATGFKITGMALDVGYRAYTNTGSVAVVQHDRLAIKVTCPTWSTNPTAIQTYCYMELTL